MNETTASYSEKRAASFKIPDVLNSTTKGTLKRKAGRILFVVFTSRGERIRLISARVAEADEEKIYEQNN